MKKFYTFLLVMLFAAGASAQEFEWVRTAGLWAYDYGYGIQTDAAGNVFVAGKYESQNAVFGDTTVPCAGNHDVFVAKYTANGDFLWVRTGGGIGGDYAHHMTLDAAGNVYVAGEIEGPNASFGSVNVTGNPGTDDAFVAKYDNNGNLQWVKTYGGYSRDDARSIAVDATGNIFICGIFRNNAFFDNQTITAASTDIDDVFIAKLDNSGNVLWVHGIGGAGDDTGKALDVDAAGNVYVTGGFIGTASFGTQSLTAPNGYRDMYLAKWDGSGNLVWVVQAGDDWDDVGWGLSVDNAGNSYVTGEFHANAAFGPHTITAITSSGDAFVAKYDALGNAQWAQRFGGNLSDRGRASSFDANNVYITGEYAGTATSGSYTVTSADSGDIFVASFNAVNGAPGWVVVPRGPADAYEDLGYEGGNALYADGTGNVYVTGSFLDVDTFNWMPAENYTRTDMFVAKINATLPPGGVGVNETAEPIGNVGIVPNPTNNYVNVSFSVARQDDYTISVTNAIGQVIRQETFKNFSGQYIEKMDLSVYGKGIYLVSVSGAGSRQVQKVVVH